MLLKFAALATTLGLGIAVPATGALHAKPTRAQIEQRVLSQMDSGPDGRITRSVHCRTAGKPGTFSCLLQSTRSTSLGARVVAGDGGLAESWEPLRG